MNLKKKAINLDIWFNLNTRIQSIILIFLIVIGFIAMRLLWLLFVVNQTIPLIIWILVPGISYFLYRIHIFKYISEILFWIVIIVLYIYSLFMGLYIITYHNNFDRLSIYKVEYYLTASPRLSSILQWFVDVFVFGIILAVIWNTYKFNNRVIDDFNLEKYMKKSKLKNQRRARYFTNYKRQRRVRLNKP